MKNFKDLQVWQLGVDIVDKVYDIVVLLPQEEKYGMRSQITRSAVSIPANISEGSAKRSEKDYMRYLEIALGSSFELETLSLIIQRRNWVSEVLVSELLVMVESEQKMLSKFIEKIKG